MGGIVAKIEPGSIAEELGWVIGDEIVSINGHCLQDVIDFRFYEADEYLDIVIRNGEDVDEFHIEKDYDLPLGVTFEDALFDGIHTCGAHCIFCFVEQLPKGLRKSLYLKDDDYRMSFLNGSYVTLANLSDSDMQRIVEQRLSPLYVSVHVTDHMLRQKIIGRNAPDILEQIDFLSKGHISIHTQIVLCRGINDGEYLDRSIDDLAKRCPAVKSIAIVPVGLSAYRKNKTPIAAIDSEYSADIIRKTKRWQKQFLEKYGTRLVWAADEFYISAGLNVPSASAYEGFPQIENGIGLVRKFKDSASRAKKILPKKLNKPLTVSTVTGKLIGPLIKNWACSLECENLEVNVYPIINNLFGEIVTVTGLISGRDIINQLKNKKIGDYLVVTSVCLRDNIFLDDVTVSDVEKELGCKLIVVDPLPYQFIRRIMDMDESK